MTFQLVFETEPEEWDNGCTTELTLLRPADDVKATGCVACVTPQNVRIMADCIGCVDVPGKNVDLPAMVDVQFHSDFGGFYVKSADYVKPVLGPYDADFTAKDNNIDLPTPKTNLTLVNPLYVDDGAIAQLIAAGHLPAGAQDDLSLRKTNPIVETCDLMYADLDFYTRCTAEPWGATFQTVTWNDFAPECIPHTTPFIGGQPYVSYLSGGSTRHLKRFIAGVQIDEVGRVDDLVQVSPDGMLSTWIVSGMLGLLAGQLSYSAGSPSRPGDDGWDVMSDVFGVVLPDCVGTGPDTYGTTTGWASPANAFWNGIECSQALLSRIEYPHGYEYRLNHSGSVISLEMYGSNAGLQRIEFDIRRWGKPTNSPSSTITAPYYDTRTPPVVGTGETYLSTLTCSTNNFGGQAFFGSYEKDFSGATQCDIDANECPNMITGFECYDMDLLGYVTGFTPNVTQRHPASPAGWQVEQDYLDNVNPLANVTRYDIVATGDGWDDWNESVATRSHERIARWELNTTDYANCLDTGVKQFVLTKTDEWTQPANSIRKPWPTVIPDNVTIRWM